MEALVTELTTSITAAGLWGAIAPIAGIIGVGVLVGFGSSYLKRTVNKLGRGKGGM